MVIMCEPFFHFSFYWHFIVVAHLQPKKSPIYFPSINQLQKCINKQTICLVLLFLRTNKFNFYYVSPFRTQFVHQPIHLSLGTGQIQQKYIRTCSRTSRIAATEEAKHQLQSSFSWLWSSKCDSFKFFRSRQVSALMISIFYCFLFFVVLYYHIISHVY